MPISGRSREAELGVAPFATRAQLERQSLELVEHLFQSQKASGFSVWPSLDDEQTNEKPQLSLAL
jgi:hypothetical protein